MKTYRLITLLAAVLITVSLTRVLAHERVGDPQARPPIAAAGVSCTGPCALLLVHRAH
jgi:hypothetical protein